MFRKITECEFFKNQTYYFGKDINSTDNCILRVYDTKVCL